MDTLAFGYALGAIPCARDFHPLDCAHAWHTKKTSGILKDAGGGEPAAPDGEREKAAERETISIRRDTSR